MKTVSKKIVEKELSETLKAVGFAFSGGTATYEIDNDFLGWMGFNMGNHPEFIRLNVSVGVHCIPVMMAFARGFGIKYRKGGAATYSVPLNSIVTERYEYVISDEINLAEVINKLVQTLVFEAKPFMEHVASYSYLENKIFSLIHQYGGNPELYALVLQHSGKSSQFESFAKSWLEECKLEQVDEWEKFIFSVGK
ncbi:hypothetical protein ALQ08_200138 [Pseudomonas syringae pv. delphinii]|uniref:Uncharacterized protein n=1 Tax=Pseudomonas syringae pv. delphinii TaxID=192088 RepID=A0A0N8RGP7_9PSED|nr:hypothetical protein [Pseudomonas syringae group genomosp. 3]KPX26583.1 hypothetical protein ALO72_200295 [Pseudomonas syringae pv. delphinii]RMP07203.1 hypothetical protein ALQ28_200006 [Pseudomonas syringae pv. delphinii]RMP18601.1 hypothetical protein ALQ27_200143 [Pseudomonas syringae pv. delphinii]RMQ21231.1 hypothetical protein ALQ08_200138 [Pseudomonas syringae pv. delphinii]